MNYDRYTGVPYDDSRDTYTHLRSLIERERKKSEMTPDNERILVGGIEIMVERREG